MAGGEGDHLAGHFGVGDEHGFLKEVEPGLGRQFLQPGGIVAAFFVHRLVPPPPHKGLLGLGPRGDLNIPEQEFLLPGGDQLQCARRLIKAAETALRQRVRRL